MYCTYTDDNMYIVHVFKLINSENIFISLKYYLHIKVHKFYSNIPDTHQLNLILKDYNFDNISE